MVNKIRLSCGLILLVVLSAGCLDGKPAVQNGITPGITPVMTTGMTPGESNVPAATPVKFSLTSKGFQEGENIPAKYTCNGQDVSPSLSWLAPPDGTKSLALIVDDPDAPGGVFTHWVLFNIPAGVASLPEGVPGLDRLEGGGVQGKNDFDEKGYNGPCPPAGKPHTYRFILYALGKELALNPGATKEDVQKAMEGYVLAKTELDGKYGK